MKCQPSRTQLSQPSQPPKRNTSAEPRVSPKPPKTYQAVVYILILFFFLHLAKNCLPEGSQAEHQPGWRARLGCAGWASLGITVLARIPETAFLGDQHQSQKEKSPEISCDFSYFWLNLVGVTSHLLIVSFLKPGFCKKIGEVTPTKIEVTRDRGDFSCFFYKNLV